jgi:hypothetical protein
MASEDRVPVLAKSRTKTMRNVRLVREEQF